MCIRDRNNTVRPGTIYTIQPVNAWFSQPLTLTAMLTLAVEKTMRLRVGLCKSSPDAQYYLNGSALRTVDEVRDLGIFVDANMCFKAHVNVIVAEAHLRANQN